MKRTARVLAVANQKGGVAKTTTVVSLGAAFADAGLRVLLVDLDAQACLTFSLGIDPDEVAAGVHDVLVGDVDAASTVLPAQEGMDLVPATIDLAGTEAQLLTVADRERALQVALAPLLAEYDVVVLDCSPSLGLLTLNALTVADEVVVPMQCEMLSHRGVGQLLDTVSDVQRLLNPDLVVRGLLPTMYDARTSHGRAVLEDVGARYGVPVLSPPIPKSVRFAEAPAAGRSVLTTSRRSKGSLAYREVAAGLLDTWGLAAPRRAGEDGQRPVPAGRPRRTSAT